MNLSRPRFRRVLAAAAGVAIGLIGAVAIATPASAHHSEISGVPYCDTTTGEWVVTWTVDSIAPPRVPTYKLVEVQVTPEGSSVTNIAVTEGHNYPHTVGTPLVGEQRLPGDATSASLGVRAKWSNGYEESSLKWGNVTFEGTCEVPQEPGPIQTVDASSCEELVVTITNPEDGETTTVTITTSTGDVQESTLEPGDSWPLSFPAEEGLSYEVTADGTSIATGAWQDPGDCETEVEIPVASLSDCDSLTVEVTNPLEDETIEATVTSGDVTETLTIGPGESAEATFEAEAGTVATVTIAGESLEIAWEEPEDCDGEGGGLPVTGTSTGIVIGVALALLALGAGLFLVARRRRVTFTA